MIKIKKIKNIVFIGLILVCIFSCNQEDFLETENKSNLIDATMWASEVEADIFLNDIYSSLPNRFTPDPLDDYTADNDGGWYYTSRNWKKGIVEASTNNYSVWFGISGPTDESNWPRTYENVRKCNTFIQKVNENIENFSDEWVAKRIDEAKFLRAFFYAELFYHVGGIVIHEEPLDRATMTEDQLYKPRLTFEATADWLTAEFSTIISNGNLPVKYNGGDPGAGRATLGAALAYKGFVQLYIASEAFNSASPAIPTDLDNLQSCATPDPARWSAAAATFKQFMDNYGPGGTGDYDLFSPM
ncbi:MAG: RagB/SusD family nutrient uptake outer membrane protein, partial [Bacteroidetes bacterium]|nr:RagB/SusD family nutrient uptake outer membrane protein [Bacteroidota bacterium]